MFAALGVRSDLEETEEGFRRYWRVHGLMPDGSWWVLRHRFESKEKAQLVVEKVAENRTSVDLERWGKIF